MSWAERRLQTLCIEDITYGVVQPGPEVAGGVLFVRSGDVKAGRIDRAALRTISREVHDQYRRTQLRGGELLISLVGNPGEVAIAPDWLCGQNVARQVGVLRLNGAVEPLFLQYYLMSADGKAELFANTLGSVQQVINLKELKALPIPVPPLDEQRAIAEVLGALDDKVELNRQMNHTLEEMASALFKSWFVDFDPIVAKADGRKPFGMDAATAALFPADFSEEAPRGWGFGCIGDLLTLQRGIDITKASQRPGPVPVVSSGGIASFHDTAAVRAPGVVIGRKGTLGTTFWMRDDFWPHDTTLWVKDFHGNSPLFVYYLLRWHEGIFLALDNGTANPTLNRNHVHPLAAVLPNRRVVGAFAATVGPWHELAAQNLQESRTLTALRDTLLPKLLSGEVRLKQAETMVEAVR